MRRSLLAAASIAALAHAPVWAQDATEITGEVDEPIDTATAGENDTASDIVITSSGRVILDGAAEATGPAVLVNSDNDLTIDSGRIEITDIDANGEDADIDGAVGVQMLGGVESDLTQNGGIFLNDSYTAVDSEIDDNSDFDEDGDPDPDGEADGPFAQDTNKTGVLIGEVDGDYDPLAGQSDVDGSASFGAASSVVVAGQDSYGVRAVTGLTGDLIAAGAINVRGERSTALSVEADIGGDVEIDNINADTPDGHGAVLDANVGGGLRLTGSIDVNGYRISSRLTQRAFELLDADPNGPDGVAGDPEGGDDIDARSAVVIAGSVVDGVFIGSGANVRLTSGQGAAIDIGSGDRDVTIGEAVLPDDFNNAEPDEDEDPEELGFALVNEGQVGAVSLYDGRDATAFLIAGRDENNNLRMVVLEAGGMLNESAISAISYDGEARGVVFGANASANATADSGLENRGAITATGALGFDGDGFGDDDPDTIDVVEGSYGQAAAFALVLGEGSQLSRILNEQGSIIARIVGGGVSATAITVENDATGLIENSGVIRADAQGLEGDWADGTKTVQLVAIDARTSTQGLRIVQTQAVAEEGETVPDATIVGDILFGSGDDTLEVLGGTVTGDVSFGGGSNRLIINNATLTGAVTNTGDASNGGGLTLDVADGRLVLTGDGTLSLTEANFGEGGVLELEVDSTQRADAFLRASGDINFAAGADLNVSLANLVGESADLTILTADGALTLADESVLDATEAPFLYNATLARSDTDPDTLVLSLRRKSAEQVGLDESRAAAYGEALAAFEAVEALGAAFAGVRTQQDFFNAYNQLLPEYATSAIQFALASNDAAAGALSVRLANARLAPDDLAGVWAQEFGYFADRSANAFGPGYRGQGVGLAVGLDRPLGPFYAVGFNVLGAASEVEEIEGFDEPMVALTGQVGTYAGLELGGMDVSGALSLGYDYFESERNILIGEFNSTNTAEWNGWHFSASGKAGRDFTFNRWIVRPEASLTYLALFESGYTESVEDEANERLALIVDDRESSALLGAATLTVSRRFGTDLSWWAPSLNIGYRGDFLSDEAETTARFGEAGSPFTLRSATLSGSGVLLGFGLSAGSNYSTFSFAYDADVRDDFVRHVARLVIRLTF
ncbi:MAG: autotransporter domain-containing protein [Oceanicaulis sp.]